MRPGIRWLAFLALAIFLVRADRAGSAPAPKGAPDTEVVPGAQKIGTITIKAEVFELSLASTADGPRLVTQNGQREWTIMDPTPKVLARLPIARGKSNRPVVPGSPVSGMTSEFYRYPALSADGSRFALVYNVPAYQIRQDTRDELVIYDAKTAKSVVVERMAGLRRGFFTPGGAFLAFDKNCNVMPAGKTKFERKFPLARPGIDALVVSSDDSRMAILTDGIVSLYDLAEGKLEFEIAVDADAKLDEKKSAPPEGPFGGGSGGFGDLAIARSADAPKLLVHAGKIVAEDPKQPRLGNRSTAQLALLDLKEKKVAGRLKLEQDMTCNRIFFTAADEPRAFLSDKGVVLEEPKKPEPKAVPKPAPKPRPRGPMLDTTIFFSQAMKGTYKVVDLTGKVLKEFTLTNPPIPTAGVPSPPWSVLSRDGKYLATMKTMHPMQVPGGTKISNGLNLAPTYQQVTIWNLEETKSVGETPPAPEKP